MSEHTKNCRWERTTEAACEFRATHHYCPHPEHACDCGDCAFCGGMGYGDDGDPERPKYHECVKCKGTGLNTPAPSGGEAREARKHDAFLRERDEILESWDVEVGNYGFPRSRDIVAQQRDLFADRLIAFTSALRTPRAAGAGEGVPVAWGWIDPYRPEVGFRVLHPNREHALELCDTFNRDVSKPIVLTPLYAHPPAHPVVTTAMMADAMMAYHQWDRDDEITDETRGKLRENFASGGLGQHDSQYVAVKRAITAALTATRGSE